MTQPEPRLVIPEGLRTRRTMHWSLKLLLVGMSVGILTSCAFVFTLFTNVKADIDSAFPPSYRHATREKMKTVAALMKDTVLVTECPVISSALDSIQKQGKVIAAQLAHNHGLINPYIEHKALAKKQDPWSIFFEGTISHLVVQYNFTTDEQLDLFLDGVTFDIDEEKSVTGVHAAAQAILGKGPEKLTPSEVAQLASAIYYPQPYIRNPEPHPGWEDILLRMRKANLISNPELELALRQAPAAPERFPASEDE